MEQSNALKESRKIVLIQNILRIWLAARAAEKRIKKHVLRTKIANELLQTELNYLKDIRTIYQEFQIGSAEVLNNEEQKILFMNIRDIIPLHIEISKVLQARIKKWSYVQTVADVLQYQLSSFKVYQEYITNYAEAASFLQKHRASSKLDKYLQAKESNSYCRGLKLESLLIMPIQRLPRYILLLKELKKHTEPSHPDYSLIVSVLEGLDNLAKTFNEAQRDKETSHKIIEIMNKVLGAEQVALETPFIYEGPITYKKIKRIKGGLPRSLSLRKSGEGGFMREVWKDLYVYLFKDTMLCAKRIASASPKTLMGAFQGKGFYKFSKTKAHTLTATTQIEVSAVSEYEVHEYRTTTPQAKELWINALQKTLATFGQRRNTIV